MKKLHEEDGSGWDGLAPSRNDVPHVTEKQRRVYYQSIVYDICNLIDKANGSRPGCGTVCGTVEHPSREVQEKLERLLNQVPRDSTSERPGRQAKPLAKDGNAGRKSRD